MKDLKQNLLRHHQREQIKTEITNAEEMLKHAKQEDAGTIRSSINRNKRQLESQSPAPLTAKEKDTLSVLEKKLRTRITTNMPTEEVMRKNPAGAVDWHQRWEKFNKPLIRMWKNAVIQLNPDNSDRDLSNIERYRPTGQVDRMRTDAQIAGHMSYHNIPEENWPFDAPANTALEQVKKNYSEDTAETDVNQALDELDKVEEAEIKAELAPERKAILTERLIKARAALKEQRDERRQLDNALDGKTEETAV